MNIWLINPYDELPGEGPEQRYGCLARYLAEKGHEVVWVSSVFRHRRKEVIRHGSLGNLGNGESGNWGNGREEVGEQAPTQPRDLRFAPKRGFRPLNDSTTQPPEIEIILLNAPAYRSNISPRRLWSQWRWGRNVQRELSAKVRKGELGKPDVVLASSPPLEGAAAGLRLARGFGAKGIVDFMDDWPETWLVALRAGRWEIGDGRWGRVLLWPWSRLARKVYSSADAVSAQSHTFARRARELGHSGGVHVCYLGAAAPEAQEIVDGRWKLGVGSQPSTLLRPGKSEVRSANWGRSTHSTTQPPNHFPSSPISNLQSPIFYILYLGAMGRVYDIDTVLRTARMAKEKGYAWSWTLAGTDPGGKWQRQSEAYGLEDVVFFAGYVQGDELDGLLAESDVGLVPMDPRSGVAVPYKVGTYLSAGLAVVNSLPGELEELLSEAGAGKNYRFGDPQSLLDAIKGYAGDSAAYALARDAARELFASKFDRVKTYPQFAEWVSC